MCNTIPNLKYKLYTVYVCHDCVDIIIQLYIDIDVILYIIIKHKPKVVKMTENLLMGFNVYTILFDILTHYTPGV